jgi:hypothetical protein
MGSTATQNRQGARRLWQKAQPTKAISVLPVHVNVQMCTIERIDWWSGQKSMQRRIAIAAAIARCATATRRLLPQTSTSTNAWYDTGPLERFRQNGESTAGVGGQLRRHWCAVRRNPIDTQRNITALRCSLVDHARSGRWRLKRNQPKDTGQRSVRFLETWRPGAAICKIWCS